MKIYDQNIWGNFSAEGQCVANRNKVIKELITAEKSEICCFQECNPKTSRDGKDAIQELLKPRYVEVKPEYSTKNYTPIFYVPTKVELIDGGYFPFDGLNDLNSKSVSWGVFKEKKTRKYFSVISTHFWWKAESKEDDLQRRENARVVSKRAKEINSKYDCPVIVCGDLNSGDTEQGSGGYDEMVTEGMKDIRETAERTDYSFTCSDNYPIIKDGKYIRGFKTDYTIDYIFVYGEKLMTAYSFSVNNSEKARISSDHSPLLLEFDVK